VTSVIFGEIGKCDTQQTSTTSSSASVWTYMNQSDAYI
jgi:hypothetical protein